MTKSPAASAPMANARRALGARPLARTQPANAGERDGRNSPEGSPISRIGPRLAGELHAMQARLEDTGRRVLGTGDELAVHDLRVAIRRTRTLLEIGRDVFGAFHAGEVGRALTDVQRATGALRDEEVLLELIASLPLHTAELGDWLAARRRRERRLRSAVRRLVRMNGLLHGRELLAALLAFRVKPSRDKRLVKFARRAVESARREVDRRRAPSDHARALHRLRVSYKRLRYTAETFADVLPLELGGALARSAAGFQKRIGDVHDVDVVVASVSRARGVPDAARQSLLATLSHLRAERESSLLKDLGWGDRKPAASAHLSGTDSLRKTSTR